METISFSRCINTQESNIRCGIADPSGEPSTPMRQKTKYNDGFFEKAFMTLFARKMGKFGAESKEKEKGLLDYDHEVFVDVSKRVTKGSS
ncbi:uncharacterized protein LOC119980843 isoform X2 [Tripterygium wilfordii]|uniref:uncharacterized protein LOC119980843 isoform X2 n=1 Tax=Tripterygium wilfordii TaxID=458696 RepID=UPI0018F84C11|nr:uncharacterized protein LOC119980843 isoform X2 [Tripterygium wilfordii]